MSKENLQLVDGTTPEEPQQIEPSDVEMVKDAIEQQNAARQNYTAKQQELSKAQQALDECNGGLKVVEKIMLGKYPQLKDKSNRLNLDTGLIERE